MENTDLKVQIRFEATGDKELAKAFTSAANAEKKLEAALKRLKKITDKNTRSTKGLGVAFHRLTKGASKWRMSLATIRSKLLVLTFGMNLFNRTLGVAIRKYQEQEKSVAMLNQTLKSTGNAARLSSRELQGLASRLQKLTGIGDETILSMQGILLTFTQIKGDIFKDATKAVLDVSVAMGQDLKQSAIQVGKALNDPRIGVSALSRVGIQFSDVQKKMIKNFADTNQIAKAQRIILSELEMQFGGTADNLDTTSAAFNRLSAAWGDFLESGGGKLAPFLVDLADGMTGVLETANNTKKSRMDEIFSVLDDDAKKAAASSIHLGDILDGKILTIMKEIGFAEDDLDLQELFSDDNKNRVIEFGEAIRDNPNFFLQETKKQIRELEGETPDILSPIIESLSKHGNVEELLKKSGALGFGAMTEQFTKAADETFAGDNIISDIRAFFTDALADGVLQPSDIEEMKEKFGMDMEEMMQFMTALSLKGSFSGDTKFFDQQATEMYGSLAFIPKWGQKLNDSLLQMGTGVDKSILQFGEEISPFADILNTIFTVDGIDFSQNAILIEQLKLFIEQIQAYQNAAGIPEEDTRTWLERFTDNLVDFSKESEEGRKAFDGLLSAGMAFSKGNKKVTIALLKMRQALAIGNVLIAFTEEWKAQNYAKAFSVLATGMMKIAQFKDQISAAREAAIGADFVTQGRQTLVVGDNPSGRERVQVTPLGNAGGGGATGSGVVVNINGNILGTDEFVRDTLIPSLEDSLGRNLA